VSKLRRARLERVVWRGYSFQQVVLYRCRQAGCRIGETPIVFENRRAGASKVNLREAVRSITVILTLGLRAFFGLDETGPRPSEGTARRPVSFLPHVVNALRQG